jgi:hypothetical protein
MKKPTKRQCFAFLNGRDGAADSDVEALMREFRLSEADAGEMYRAWLDRPAAIAKEAA